MFSGLKFTNMATLSHESRAGPFKKPKIRLLSHILLWKQCRCRNNVTSEIYIHLETLVVLPLIFLLSHVYTTVFG